MPLPESAAFASGALRNPFSAARVQPGALPYVLPDGVTAADLLSRFEAARRCAQILGPHGAGKSTLLATLHTEWRALGREVALWRAGRDRRVPGLAADGILLADEFDSLPVWRRAWVRRAALARGCGLVASVHADLGMPTLWVCQPDAAVLGRLVDGLAVGWGVARPSLSELRSLLDRCGGDMREALFVLYDLYEQRSAPRGDAQ